MAPPQSRPTLFDHPRRYEYLEEAAFHDDKSTLGNTINSLNFNHVVDVFLPNCAKLPRELSQVFDAANYEYYLARGECLSTILDWDFIGAFIRNGHMTIFSHGTRADTGNCVCVYHPGQLVLSLDKDSYEELGLQGKASEMPGHRNKGPVKYVVSIDLLAKDFYPGRKLYDRAMLIFKQRSWLRFDLLFCWTPHDDSISSRSLYNYLKSRGGREGTDETKAVMICTLRHKVRSIRLTQIPHVDCSDWRGVLQDDNCSFTDFIEWIGAIACDANCSDTVDPFISTYSCPKPIDRETVVTHARWSGFLASSTVLKLVHCLRNDQTLQLNWAAVVVHGYGDVPKASSLESSAWYPSDPVYTIVMFPSSRYWLCRSQAKVSGRSAPEKKEKMIK